MRSSTWELTCPNFLRATDWDSVPILVVKGIIPEIQTALSRRKQIVEAFDWLSNYEHYNTCAGRERNTQIQAAFR
jgi:hypothetical protein